MLGESCRESYNSTSLSLHPTVDEMIQWSVCPKLAEWLVKCCHLQMTLVKMNFDALHFKFGNCFFNKAWAAPM